MAAGDPKADDSGHARRDRGTADGRAQNARVTRENEAADASGKRPDAGGESGIDPAASGGFRSTGTQVRDLDATDGLVAPGERDDQDGPLPNRDMNRDSGAGAAGGHDTSGGRSGAAASPAEAAQRKTDERR